MGKYAIGARVRDPNGDEGVIIDKRKGGRKVEYDDTNLNYTEGWWWPKADLAVIEPKPGFKVRDRVVVDYRRGSDLSGTFIGTIQVINVDGSTDVTFDDGWTDGHDGDANDGSTNHWYVNTEDLKPFTIEAGRCYRTRDGKKVGPMEPYDSYSGRHPWQWDGWLWQDNGINYDGIDDPMTIVALWTEAETVTGIAAEPIQAGDLVTIEAGKFYRTRDGRRVGPMSRDSGLTGWPWQNPGNGDSYRDDGTFGVNEGVVCDEDLVAEWAEPAATPKFKVGDIVNYTLTDTAWQGVKITEVLPGEVNEYRGVDTDGAVGVFIEDWIALAPAKPAVDSAVSVTGKLIGIDDEGDAEVHFDSLGCTLFFPASALSLAA